MGGGGEAKVSVTHPGLVGPGVEVHRRPFIIGPANCLSGSIFNQAAEKYIGRMGNTRVQVLVIDFNCKL